MNDLITQFRYNDDDSSCHNHSHLSCEVIFVLEGEAEFVVDGNRYLARRGSIVFVNSFELHEITIQKTPYKRYFMTINVGEIERVLSYSSLSSIFKNRPSGFRHCIHITDTGRISDLFLQMYREYSAPAVYSAQLLQNLFEQLLILVYRTCPDNFCLSQNTTGSRVAAVQQYIEQHFTEDLKIPELAERFFVSGYYLSHTFKEQVGYSPKQYLLLNRLSYAQELLETTDLQVSQIAYKCGFGDVNNFIRSFKAWFGTPPNQFRLGIGEGAMSGEVETIIQE